MYFSLFPDGRSAAAPPHTATPRVCIFPFSFLNLMCETRNQAQLTTYGSLTLQV